MVEALLDPQLDPTLIEAGNLPDRVAALPPSVTARCRQVDALRREADDWQRAAKRHNLHVLTPSHPAWPQLLADCPTRPLVLFVAGDLAALTQPGLAIVGSRSPTPYGQAAAADFSGAIARAGLCIWSGLARGIDAVSHRACIEQGTPTIAVLAGGLDRIYPADHGALAAEVRQKGGALVSESPPGVRPRRGHFPRRNRILAGATQCTLVVEAGISSGTMHTARAAGDAGRPIFAMPGPYTSPSSRGCHELIRDGAEIALDPAELLHGLGLAIGGVVEGGARGLELSAEEQSVLDVLRAGPRPTDLVQREAGFERGPFLRVLLRLVQAGVVLELPGDLVAVQTKANVSGSRGSDR